MGRPPGRHQLFGVSTRTRKSQDALLSVNEDDEGATCFRHPKMKPRARQFWTKIHRAAPLPLNPNRRLHSTWLEESDRPRWLEESEDEDDDDDSDSDD